MRHQLSIINGKIEQNTNGFIRMDLYVNPDENELRYLSDTLKIDRHLLMSSMDPEETPRMEFRDNYFAVMLKYPKRYSGEENFSFPITTVGIFLFPPNYAVGVVDSPIPIIHTRVRSSYIPIKNIQDSLLLNLNKTIRAFEENLRIINIQKNKLKQKMSQSQKNQYLKKMLDLREGLVYYINALEGNGHLIERMRASAKGIGFSDENLAMLDDLKIENQQFLEQAQVYSEILSGLMEGWNAIINNNLNTIMKNMNSLVIAISIPTFLTGLGGMSEFTEMVKPYISPYISFPILFIILCILAFLSYKLIQRHYRS